jgi:hypothetical protein
MSKQKITEQINQDLYSTDDKVVLNALSTARQKGNKDNMPGIVHLLTHESTEIREAATKILFDLKDVEAVPALIDCLLAEKNKTVRNTILQSLWQSNIQPVHELSRLIDIAIKGTLEECIEVYSIVTNMVDVVIPEAELMEGLLLINNNLENIRDKHQKQLLNDMAGFLQENLDQ